MLLVTLDVESLYSNIPYNEGIVACRDALDNKEILQPSTEARVQLMEFVPNRNNFTFENKHYLQIQEMDMGTRMPPLCANLFMVHLEKRILESVDLKPNVW